jgi:hypothetical protein
VPRRGRDRDSPRELGPPPPRSPREARRSKRQQRPAHGDRVIEPYRAGPVNSGARKIRTPRRRRPTPEPRPSRRAPAPRTPHRRGGHRPARPSRQTPFIYKNYNISMFIKIDTVSASRGGDERPRGQQTPVGQGPTGYSGTAKHKRPSPLRRPRAADRFLPSPDPGRQKAGYAAQRSKKES